MVKKSFIYGDDGIRDMLDYLNSVNRSLDSFSKDVATRSADYAESQINKRLSGMDLDENSAGVVMSTVSSTSNGAKAVVSHVGDDVAYLEFGTGMVGKQSPHPLSPQYNWEYYIDTVFKKTVKGRAGWWFNSDFHVGIAAGRSVYNAAVDLRNNLKRIAKESISNAINH